MENTSENMDHQIGSGELGTVRGEFGIKNKTSFWNIKSCDLLKQIKIKNEFL